MREREKAQEYIGKLQEGIKSSGDGREKPSCQAFDNLVVVNKPRKPVVRSSSILHIHLRQLSPTLPNVPSTSSILLKLWQETVTAILPVPPRKKVIHCWLVAVQHRNEKRRATGSVSTLWGLQEKKRERPVVLASAEGTHHARCTRTQIAHARTQQNHREWGTLSPLTSKASAHRECHGGAFQSSTKGFLW